MHQVRVRPSSRPSYHSWLPWAVAMCLVIPVLAYTAPVSAKDSKKKTETEPAVKRDAPKKVKAAKQAVVKVAAKKVADQKDVAKKDAVKKVAVKPSADKKKKAASGRDLVKKAAAKQPAARAAVRKAKKKTSDSTFAHAILLNGGQNPQVNFYSHVLYLRMMRRALNELGLEDDDMTIVAADGNSPKPDQAILREQRRPEQWLFAYRPESKFYPRQPSIINTVIKGKTLVKARRKVLEKLTSRLAKEVKGSKKPVFMFVTDHGTPNRKLKHHRNNRISLWKENWSVQQFHKALRAFGRRRVISVMSQCFSGSFMWSIFRKPGRFGVPFGDRCGFYATLPSRYAYGCFPETRLKKQVGHAYRFILAMRHARTFDEAHREVLLTDLTPDVPHRSSDGYLYAMLRMDAKADGIKPEKLVDQILNKYKEQSYAGMKEDMSLVSDIAKRFGLIRPMDMATLVKQRDGITKRMRWWERVEGLWRNVYATARNYHLEQIYKANPELRKNVRALQRKNRKFFEDLYRKHKELRKRQKLLGLKLGALWPLPRTNGQSAPSSLKQRDAQGKVLCQAPETQPVPPPAAPPTPAPPPTNKDQAEPPPAPAPAAPPTPAPNTKPAEAKLWPASKTVTVLRNKLLTYVQARPQLLKRLRMLYLKEREMAKHVFLIKSQLAALKRIEVLYYRVAGRLLVEHDPHPDFRSYREGIKRLIACEHTPLRSRPVLVKRKPLEDLEIGATHPPLPSWFGISFRPIPPQERGDLPSGAVQVEAVYLNTPAQAAGMRVGDIVVAVNNEQLREPHEIRERVMLSPAKKPTPMLVLRRGKLLRLEVPLRLQTTPPPMKLPPLLGKVFPNLESGRLLSNLKQPLPYTTKGTYMLFFWATWCGPCKAALPTMRKWKASYGKLGFRTITISNEKPSVVNGWLNTGNNAQRMPFINAYDLKRYELFRQFRVQGTPTFVVIKDGKVNYVHVGFRKLEQVEKAIVDSLKD